MMLLLPFLVGLAAASPILSEVTPFSTSCSPASFTNITHFTLLTYKIETVTTPRDNGIQGPSQLLATFAVQNPGSGDTYVLNRIPISTGGGVWSTCIAGETPLPGELKRCMYILERRKDGRVGFRFQWVCSGSGTPLLFDATIIGNMPTEVCTPVSGVEGVTQLCELDEKEVVLPVANIYWEEGYTG